MRIMLKTVDNMLNIIRVDSLKRCIKNRYLSAIVRRKKKPSNIICIIFFFQLPIELYHVLRQNKMLFFFLRISRVVVSRLNTGKFVLICIIKDEKICWRARAEKKLYTRRKHFEIYYNTEKHCVTKKLLT
ncbi:unnamed protein product [Aphis gossypii]|uniref:Uncharacterized protein n=1 Tax=Aphis gossypii TaxID=80765 RepID=A0A9P0NC57_APHGO|nr:unnamed protein product [Aphis gossypii]